MCIQYDLCYMNTTCTYIVANVYWELCSKDFLEDFMTLVSTSPSGGHGWCFRQNVLACPASSGISRDVATEGPSTFYTWEKMIIRINKSKKTKNQQGRRDPFVFLWVWIVLTVLCLFPETDDVWGVFEGSTHSWIWFCSFFFLVPSATHSNCLIFPPLRVEHCPLCIRCHNKWNPLKLWARTKIPNPRLFLMGILLQWHKRDGSTFEVSHMFSTLAH